MHLSWSHCSFAALLAIMVVAGAVSGTSPVIADTALADPYIDRLAEAADTPALNWADCGDGFLCATAVVPLNYNRPSDEQIDLAAIKLPATDPGRRSLATENPRPPTETLDCRIGRARRIPRPADASWDRIYRLASQEGLPRTE